jgi:hypothetical protein
VSTVTPTDQANEALPPQLALAFAPLHKRAFGTAVGLATGVLIFAATAVYIIRDPHPGFALALLGHYFYGYTVSWSGAVIGFAWGFGTGFVAGWFIAFCRNLVLAVSIFAARTRADMAATRDFLDHI